MDLPHFIILRNEVENDHQPWIDACLNMTSKLTFSVVNITKEEWLKQILSFSRIDCLLAKPSGQTSIFKQLYDERITILVKELGFKIFPSLDEILIYENKRYLSYWLKAHKIPHPETKVFYHRDEAFEFIQNVLFPLVAKMNIGASGNGIVILKRKEEAEEYIRKTFETGMTSRTGPRFDKGKLFSRALKKFTHPSDLLQRLATYRSISNDVQHHFIIFQEYIAHEFEWRVVKIGKSYFAHKKLVKKGKASGLLLKGYENPPLDLLSFVKDITERFSFQSQAVDIFVRDHEYLVNEMQCIFGQSDPYQMLVDGVPGRYIFGNGKWQFEMGLFNTNRSYDLRIEAAMDMVK